jgi:hypothetical protein
VQPVQRAASRGGRHAITIISLVVVIAVQVFIVSYAAAWVVSHVFEFDTRGRGAAQTIFLGSGAALIAAFVRQANRVEPFTRLE